MLNASDKRGGRSVASSSKNGLQKIIDDFGFIDLGFVGHAFTWNNRRGGHANIQERIGRGFAIDSWKILCSQAVIIHLLSLKYDHCPLLLNTCPNRQNLSRPFRFESMWILHNETSSIIQAAWQRFLSFASKLKKTKLALKKWNKESFGHVQTNIVKLKETI